MEFKTKPSLQLIPFIIISLLCFSWVTLSGGTKMLLCYTCPNFKVEFMHNNVIIEKDKDKEETTTRLPTPKDPHTHYCNYHSNITCSSFCYVQARKWKTKGSQWNYTVSKGCARDNEQVGCTPMDKDNGKVNEQRCVCNTSYCNLDIAVLGDSKFYSGGTMSKSRHPVLLVILAVFLLRCQLAESLACCIYTQELTTKNENGVEQHCTNTGTNCKNVNCNGSKCLKEQDSDPDDPETDCLHNDTCPQSNALCRLLYYEIAELKNKKKVDLTYYVEQSCHDQSYMERKVGCDFLRKIFYQTATLRFTILKDCYSDKNYSNTDIATTCMYTDPSIKNISDTCEKKNGGSWGAGQGGGLVVGGLLIWNRFGG